MNKFNKLSSAELNKSYSLSPRVHRALKKNHSFWSRKGLIAILTYTIVVILASLFVKSMWDGYWRTHSWKFQTPIIFQTPLIIEEVKPQAQQLSPIVKEEKQPLKAELQPSKPLTEYEQVMKQPHGKILWNIYDLESERGETDYCRLNGKGFGGFGVKDGQKPVSQIVCYETFAKAVERAEYWFARLNPDKDLATALCTWNTGRPEVNCHYYQNYLTY